MKTYFVALGSNLGDREDYLRQALKMMADNEDINIEKISSFIETPPWGNINQGAFINAACRLKTKLKPLELLDFLQGVEQKLGRVRKEHWGPRTIDLDILSAFDGKCEIILTNERLILPHPYMWERSFVLLPLSEICSDWYDIQKITEVIDSLE